MGKIIHGINAPFISGIVVTHVSNTVNDRISHVDVGTGHIYPGAENLLTVGIYAVFHVLE